MKEKLSQIGKAAQIKMENGLYVDVIIKDYKNAYGNDTWLVSPIAGNGEAWVRNIIPVID